MRSRWIFLLVFAICCHLSIYSSLQEVWDAQIQEELSGITPRSFTPEKLLLKFHELSDVNLQVLYCRIRKNRVQWLKSTKRDEFRNEIVFNYFSELARKYPLPDTDFILCINDGFHENSEIPLFTFAADKKSKKNVCLFPDFEALRGIDINGLDINNLLEYSQRFPWEQKCNKMFFRGAATGKIDLNEPFFGNDRVRLMYFSYDHPDLVEADFTVIFDEPIVDLMKKLGKPIVSSMLVADHFHYKYLLDVDGNSSTYSRCRWILASNSVLLKVSSDFTQWYYKLLAPYENYIPVRQDLSDLLEIFDWLTQHDADAHAIAMNGQNLGKVAFTKENIDYYVCHLLKGYSEKIELRRQDMRPLRKRRPKNS